MDARAGGLLDALRHVRDVIELGWRHVMYWHWRRQSSGGPIRAVSGLQDVTVIIPAFSPARVRNLATLARTALRCDFVSRVIVSRNNPGLDLSELGRIDDTRLSVIEQPERRGCGVVWGLAEESGGHVIVVDDDVLVYPRQLARLAAALQADPASPHGLCGIRAGRYVVGRESAVDNLFCIYAITAAQARHYGELTRALLATGRVSAETVEFLADDVILSRSGGGMPRVHDAGYFLLCPTATSRAVALWKGAGFDETRDAVLQELLALENKSPVGVANA